MGFLGDLLFGSDKQTSNQSDQFEGTETSKVTGTQKQRQDNRTASKQGGTTRQLSKQAQATLEELLQQSTKRGDRVGTQVVRGLDQTDQLVRQLITEAGKDSGLDVDALMSVAEERSRNALQQETTRLAEAGGSSLNTIISSLNARSGTESAIELGGLEAELLARKRSERLAGITAGIEASGAATQLRSDVVTNARTLPVALATQLASVLKGATTTTKQAGEERSISDVISRLSQTAKTDKTGSTTAYQKNKGQNKPGLFDFFGF